jgi:hypothetical protein
VGDLNVLELYRAISEVIALYHPSEVTKGRVTEFLVENTSSFGVFNLTSGEKLLVTIHGGDEGHSCHGIVDVKTA